MPPQVVPCMVTENKIFHANGFCISGIQRNLKAHIIGSCLRMKALVPPSSHWSGLSSCAPPQISTRPKETQPFFRGDSQSPMRLQGRKYLPSQCPWHSPGMDRPRVWTDYTFLVSWHSSASSSHTDGHKVKDFLAFTMSLAPGQRDAIVTCVPFTSLRGSDIHCARGVMRWLTRGRNWHMSLCFSTTTVIFLLSPPNQDVFALLLGVLPDPTYLHKNSIMVFSRASISEGIKHYQQGD